METFDVVVIGGGPAGASAGIRLARSGRRVAILERSRYGEHRVGETLPPAIKIVLQQLDAWTAFVEGASVASPGIVSFWGSTRAYENDYILNPHGTGWHVDRQWFDAMLAGVAERCGVRVYLGGDLGTTPLRVAESWRLSAPCDAGPVELSARFLIDASGRNASVALRLGAHKVFVDRLVAVVHFYDRQDENGDPRTLIEADEGGWWYSALLPGGRLVAAYMTDADLLPKTLDLATKHCGRTLRRTPHTRDRLEKHRAPSSVSIVPARSSVLADCPGDTWLAAGDAVATVDPLSSSGLTFALESGMRAADTVHAMSQGTTKDGEAYSHWVAATFSTYLTDRSWYYARERRWPGAPFWRRRSSPAVASVVAGVAERAAVGA